MSASSPILSIIVVSYNTRDMTLECLRSLRDETSLSYELIVVDNASEDGSAEAIAEECPGIELMAETENHGFAKANNLAAEHARGKYLLLLNPDTIILDRAVDNLVAFAERTPDARIWGGRTLYANGDLNPTSCRRRMSLWTVFCRTSGLTGIFRNSALFNSEDYGGWDRGTERNVDIVTGCFFLIKRTDWATLGGFDPTFFMYGEETDLCRRANRVLGASPRVTPKATIIHYGGASEKVRSDKMVKVLRAKSEQIKRHIPAWQRPLANLLFLLWPLTRSIVCKVVMRDNDTSQVWHEVWRRRREWKSGF